jgi:predicted O-methyltransferase YrrM
MNQRERDAYWRSVKPRALWRKAIPSLFGKVRQAIEIGAFEGDTSLFIARNMLKPAGSLYCIDPYEASGSMEFTRRRLARVRETFQKRTRKDGRIRWIGESIEKLPADSPARIEGGSQLIYVDGAHTAKAVLRDAVHAWPLLAPGGVMVFDDYEWCLYEDPRLLPRMAVDAFLEIFSDELQVIYRGYQMMVRKRIKRIPRRQNRKWAREYFGDWRPWSG